MITPEQRAQRVQEAIVALADSIQDATNQLEAHGPTAPVTLAAWERVEQSGAVVHRQSRLLAGKSKGG
jgi:hypothetical protein